MPICRLRLSAGPLLSILALVLTHDIAVAHEPSSELGFLTCDLIQNDEASAPAAIADAREMLCSFKRNAGGPDETYFGTLQSVSMESADRRSLIWLVKSNAEVTSAPGLLQQTYSADSLGAGQNWVPLIGQTNRLLSLHSLAEMDHQPSADGDQVAPGAALMISLRLNSAVG